MNRKYVFGPVRSRRLGISLGVDLVTPKTCPLDCIYCEARATTNLTLERREYVPVDQVISELDETLKTIPAPDFITFSGAGEPTLNSGIGKVVGFLKTHYPKYQICLLTNGLLLGDPELCSEIADVDLLVPSLDASNEFEYRKINRPVAGSTLAKLAADIAAFSKNFRHCLKVEIFIIPGINDSDASISAFARLLRAIRPAAVQLNTLDRPGVIPDIRVAPSETLQRFETAFTPICPVETLKPLPQTQQHVISTSLEEQLLNIISHRRLNISSLSQVANIPEPELRPLLDRLLKRKWIRFSPNGDITLV